MWKNILALAGGAVLAISLPLAALAATTDDPMVADEAPYMETDQYSQSDPVVIQDQTLVRQQLRIHAETGPPEGFEPIQQRLHQQDQLGIGNPDAPMGNGVPLADGSGAMHRGGNPDAPMDGTGECTNPDGPIGTGPHGPGTQANG
jgi:hypothetical protein